ncbi:phenylacetate--CoA ligase family protein [Lutibacter sp.]|uniref:phenylacetate--CoA ligase family protein n=1 Tax=Lutibacter sp. TaxID=1925666 RepID=UPI003567032B
MIEQFYARSPVFLQNIYISIYGYYWKRRRYGGCFSEKLKEFKQHENFSEEQWIAYQTFELRKLLIHSYTTVPFYRKKYTEYGFTIQDFENFELEDLQKLPYLEKDELRKYGTTTLLSNKRGKGKFYNSSGSTGTPTQIYFSKKFHQTWSALYELRVRNWAGVNYKLPRAMIGGRRVILSDKPKPPYFRYNKAESQAYFSAYHISDNTAKEYVLGLQKSKATYLVGYAMSIYLLSQSIRKQNLKAPKLKAVLTSSEKLTTTMRTIIENTFQCKVFDAYSGVEACGLISENKKGELLFSPDSGIMEVLDSNGKNLNYGKSGEVVATGFLNYDQPLIRYRIGDSVKLSENQKTFSGSKMLKIDEIEGRIEDVIIGSKGQKMVRFHGIFVGIPSIIMAQVIQKTLNQIEIKLVVENSYETNFEKVMIDRIKSQLGEVLINFSYVNEIEKTTNGKYKAVISNLKNG